MRDNAVLQQPHRHRMTNKPKSVPPKEMSNAYHLFRRQYMSEHYRTGEGRQDYQAWQKRCGKAWRALSESELQFWQNQLKARKMLTTPPHHTHQSPQTPIKKRLRKRKHNSVESARQPRQKKLFRVSPPSDKNKAMIIAGFIELPMDLYAPLSDLDAPLDSPLRVLHLYCFEKDDLEKI